MKATAAIKQAGETRKRVNTEGIAFYWAGFMTAALMAGGLGLAVYLQRQWPYCLFVAGALVLLFSSMTWDDPRETPAEPVLVEEERARCLAILQATEKALRDNHCVLYEDRFGKVIDTAIMEVKYRR